MSLVISKNGKIQDFKRPSTARKVNSVHDNDSDNKVHFEDVMEKENNREKDPEHFGEPRHNEKQANAIRSYQNQKKQSLKHSKIIHGRDVCSSPVITLTPEDRVEKAIELMKQYQIHHIPLLNEEQKVCGIISDRDLILKRLSDRLERHMTAEVLMAKDITEIKMIAKMMITHHISALPLINDQDNLVGIITKTDMLECLVRSLPLEQYV